VPLSDTQASFIEWRSGAGGLSRRNDPWPRGGVVTQRSAKPFTPVQFRAWPPSLSPERTTSQSPNAALESAPFWHPGEQIHNAAETGHQRRKPTAAAHCLIVRPRPAPPPDGIAQPHCGLVSFWAVRLEQYERAAGLLLDSSENAQTIVDPKDAAQSAGLRYVSDARPGIRRKKTGTGFTYTRADGSKLSDPDVLKRIKALVIPPAWADVWISPFVDGHLQATGRDAKGRKQYRYHALFREVLESTKYEHVVAFADELPAIRKKVHEHMGRRGLPREKVLATVIHLLETTLIRIGNEDYAKQNNSYGLTTLKNRHVAVDGNEIRFRFTGKSGKQWSLRVRDRRVAKIIKACQDLPGQELLQ
jgi:Eukaryotic DNA topoisomerase I, catalytic core